MFDDPAALSRRAETCAGCAIILHDAKLRELDPDKVARVHVMEQQMLEAVHRPKDGIDALLLREKLALHINTFFVDNTNQGDVCIPCATGPMCWVHGTKHTMDVPARIIGHMFTIAQKIADPGMPEEQLRPNMDWLKQCTQTLKSLRS